jgi:glyoxylase-like metal-dependent hydrolase (beta-lactamase superfamily II)
MNIGPYSISIIETSHFGLDGGAMFGVVPKTLWERAYAPADARNRIPMATRSLLLRSDDRVILVDTGNSPLMNPKLAEIYGLDFSKVGIETSLAHAGVAPEEVTDVILTHLHFDHAGGTTVRDGDAWRLRFPNAWHYVQKEQWEWAHDPTEKDRASFMPEYYDPIREYGRLELLDGPGELMPMITVDTLYGHTAALQSVKISDGTTTLYFPADLMPTAAHVPVPYGMGYDNHPLTTMAEKHQILPKAVEEEWIIVFEHDALRQAGRLEFTEKGARLKESITITDFGAPAA